MEDDWGFSAEELDSMEKEALKRVAVKNTFSSSQSPSKSPSQKVTIKIFRDSPGRIALQTQYNTELLHVLKSVVGHEWDQSRRIWTYPESQLENLEVALSSLKDIISSISMVSPIRSHLRSVQGCTLEQSILRELPPVQGSGCGIPCSPDLGSKGKGLSPQNMKGQIRVVLYLIGQDRVAAQSPYNERIKEACQSVKGRQWNAEERVWTFPLASLKEAVDSLTSIISPVVTIEASPPLVLPALQVSHGTGRRCEGDRSVKTSLWNDTSNKSCIQDNVCPKNLEKITIKFFLHPSCNIAAKFDYQQALVNAIKKIPKCTWQAKERLWLFPFSSLSSAEKVPSEVDGLDVEVYNLDSLVRRALDAASNVSDLHDLYKMMPSNIESNLLPFQRDGVRFLLEHGGRALLADEMGLGKTIQAIAFSSCIQDSWPVLVLTPSSLRLHWATMINQWLNIPPSDILVVLSQFGGSNRAGFKIVHSISKGSIQLDGVFNIISYDMVTKLQHVLLASKFKIVIADESHFLKNPQAKRTSACLPILQRARHVVLLTGTPALSRPIELFKQLEALYPDVYNNVHEYGQRYCKGGIFGLYQGASNHDELHNLIKATVMFRRLKKDVLSQLPVKRRQQVFLDLDEKEMKQIRALFRELEMVKNKIKACTSQEEVDTLKFSEKQLINKIFNDSAEAKIPAVLDYLETIVEAGCKFLIFAYHQPMMDAIHQFLLKKNVGLIRIDGSTPTSTRQDLVTQFQEKDNVKAAVLSIKAGGVGLTLTAASTVIFAELSWTPGDIIQAEDRAHRIGQVSSVNIYYLLANDTVDDIIWDVIQSKLENLGQVFDGRENSLEVSNCQTRNRSGSQAMNSPSQANINFRSQTVASSSPSKGKSGVQTSLDSFLKRCRGSDGSEDDHLKPKNPRL
ncbi:SWI/SNF-related matrix-associated actin-dependent regulator of chromatin subfamily A-like protein 1 isoform X2 [Amborella trichopoda]|uniref:SWI/SNF-related matrix-associated actin-dependent regulator of chromatin subfamily A-like protein 1 isoform X2 n=1 Tax=Amborella trichopoda TaxID=13333 RepID=UPI0005D337C4|nr:SWI/SNF-related matrix-associated actin-dependent regulator of chromatin subfamily A-like protein 1 isoform X2 [Amborella trichopoda]|eukprot:XP_011621950.1 SWI/SNF-related matrix-associated actin-dependent regulator of chromatin subfamily A-like protein 1 isoform X2 [Amborella trichopoda]